MQGIDYPVRSRVTVQEHDNSLFVALELSRSIWLVAVSAPGNDKISKYRIEAGDNEALLKLLSRLEAEAERLFKLLEGVPCVAEALAEAS